MTTNNEALAEVLNDLVKINNDRITGYETAIDEINEGDIDLKGMFRKMANDSRDNVKELSELVLKNGGEVSHDTTVPGKIYRTWMNVKAAITGSDRKAILGSCEYGEDAAQSAYEEALGSDAEMSADIRQLITNQKSSLKTSHDVIKKYRDLHASVNK